jgi:hypothetical protein
MKGLNRVTLIAAVVYNILGLSHVAFNHLGLLLDVPLIKGQCS